MLRASSILILGLIAGPVFAEGDPEAGESAFKKCKACHAIASADEVFAKGGKTGPNLYGLPGRAAGTVEDYKYGDDLVAAGAAGLIWDEATFAAYVADPRGFLKETLDDSGAKSKMSYKLKSGAEDIWAFIASVSPAAE